MQNRSKNINPVKIRLLKSWNVSWLPRKKGDELVLPEEVALAHIWGGRWKMFTFNG